jgi:hypothetical protein
VKLGLPGEGRLEALFHSSLTRVVLPDLGADDNVIPASLISELEAAGLLVPLRTLPSPMTVDLAVQGPGLSTLVTRQAKLTIELQLPAGPLHLRNVKWLVAENDMDEVLRGRPSLNALGIDAEARFAAVLDTFQDMDCETIPSVVTGGRLSRILIHRDLKSKGFGGTEPQADPSPDTSPIMSCSPALLVPARADLAATPVVYGDRDPIQNGSLLDLPSTLSDMNLFDAIEGMLSMTSDQGLTPSVAESLRTLVFEFADIWRLGFSSEPPARLPPMQISLQPGAAPVRVRVRKYPVEQRAFLTGFVNELVSHGLEYRNPHATWCCAPLLVPKEGPGGFRFTVDLRPVNKVTIASPWPMPLLESELSRVAGCYGALAMCMIGCAGPPTPSKYRMYHTLVAAPAFLVISTIGPSATVLL